MRLLPAIRRPFQGICVMVPTYRGEFEPPMIEEGQEQEYLKQLLVSDRTATDKALTLMYHNMRQQMFYDGNKRTAPT